MSEEEKKEQKQENSGAQAPESGNGEEYRFLDQKIKKRPVNRRALLTRILWIVIAGVAVGLIAALVISLIHPELSSGVSTQEEAKITIPADEEPETVSEEASEAVPESSSESEKTEPEETPEETAEQQTAAISSDQQPVYDDIPGDELYMHPGRLYEKAHSLSALEADASYDDGDFMSDLPLL